MSDLKAELLRHAEEFHDPRIAGGGETAELFRAAVDAIRDLERKLEAALAAAGTEPHICIDCGTTQNVGPCYHVCFGCSEKGRPAPTREQIAALARECEDAVTAYMQGSVAGNSMLLVAVSKTAALFRAREPS